jgi:peptide/nickel transport system substrate-binding protein
VRSKTRRNPNYFKDGPYFDEIETLAISDVTTRVSALRTGDVDVIDKPDTKTLHLLKSYQASTSSSLAATRTTRSPC